VTTISAAKISITAATKIVAHCCNTLATTLQQLLQQLQQLLQQLFIQQQLRKFGTLICCNFTITAATKTVTRCCNAFATTAATVAATTVATDAATSTAMFQQLLGNNC